LLACSEAEIRAVRGRDIAMIFQEPMTSLNPVYSIGRQLTETVLLRGNMSAAQAVDRAVYLLEKVGMPSAAERLGQYPHQLSGGQRQRVMIAMALMNEPEIIIADEPTTALDVTIQAQIVELVKRLRDELGMAIVWITHDLGVVAGLADRVIVMYAGFIVEEAPVEDLYGDPRHPYTLALMGALPRADRRREHRLESIPGAPPSMVVEPKGCPFAPRCNHVIQRCLDENPPLAPIADGHQIACWVDVKTGEVR